MTVYEETDALQKAVCSVYGICQMGCF